jgi:2-succinyl-5-enolpyruvyl-6-hydroxy-3-cyclohexene-1-carboxylate synthase
LPVFLGNSLTVRSADWFAGRTPQPLRICGNRGVSGIDGNLSTACGIAAAYGRTLAVVGDLAFLHDLNALALARESRLTVLLLDNGGSGIFDHLAQAALPEFEQAWLTPQSLDASHAAAAFGLSYVRAASVREAVAAILAALDAPTASVVHVPIDRNYSLTRIRAFHSASNQGA